MAAHLAHAHERFERAWLAVWQHFVPPDLGHLAQLTVPNVHFSHTAGPGQLIHMQYAVSTVPFNNSE